MAICPDCLAKIDKLDYEAQLSVTGTFKLNKDGTICDDRELVYDSDFRDESYCCPHCGVGIACTEEEAEEFLTSE